MTKKRNVGLERRCVDHCLKGFASVLSSQIPLFHALDLPKSSYNIVTMSGLVQAMAILMDTFQKYSGKEGDKDTLTKAELTEMLHKELPGAGDSNKAAVDNFFSMLDNDKDGIVDFTEYVTFVTAITVLCNKK
ncbi:ictacalcin-like [Seriola lalandi dorsalis]|uniref:Protein S100 n=1 Tax=Seriola lalandi dorsalis TaxID=1841481 RepID=A0A3B4Y4D7_SERLL|nr:ictacalcin-like [Seriola lalandi dorsalis]XP_056236562.1 ictacalcin-like [Seriola aureovittata]